MTCYLVSLCCLDPLQPVNSPHSSLKDSIFFFFISTFLIIVLKSLGVFGQQLVVGHLDEMCDLPSDVKGGHSVSLGNTFSTSTSVPTVES